MKTYLQSHSYPKKDINKKWIDIGKKRIVQIGHGAIGGCMIDLYLRHIKLDDPSQIIVLEMNSEHIPKNKKGCTYKHIKIVKENYREVLTKYLRKGDILVDLAWYISTLDLLTLCRETGSFFVNAAVELWEIDQIKPDKDPREYTLYHRQMEIQKVSKQWGKNGPTAVITHGANPGWVSHTTKWALREWIKLFEKHKVHKDIVVTGNKILQLIDQTKDRDIRRILWSKLAQLLKVQVIHISERDTLISNIPRQLGTFVCTWSPQGFIEEGMAPAELGWGTHETLKKGVYGYKDGPRNQVCFDTRGMNTLCQTFVPSGNYVGMVVRHEEAYSISEYLTVYNENKAVYRPTVHYAYYPCSDAVASMYELQSNGYKPPEREHVPRDDCIKGQDELGCFLLSRDYGAWWIGTIQSIEDSRKLLKGQSPTILVVAAGVLGAVIWSFMNPNHGVIHPEQMDENETMSYILPYLEPFVSGYIEDWKPFVNTEFNKKQHDTKDWIYQKLSASSIC